MEQIKFHSAAKITGHRAWV